MAHRLWAKQNQLTRNDAAAGSPHLKQATQGGGCQLPDKFSKRGLGQVLIVPSPLHDGSMQSEESIKVTTVVTGHTLALAALDQPAQVLLHAIPQRPEVSNLDDISVARNRAPPRNHEGSRIG